MNDEQFRKANMLKDAICLCNKLLRYFENPELFKVYLEIPSSSYANGEELWVKNKAHKIIIDFIEDGIRNAKKSCEEEFDKL